MAAKGKVQRLRKVAAEFNLGTHTLVEFLEKKKKVHYQYNRNLEV
jgi:hypothetical protein